MLRLFVEDKKGYVDVYDNVYKVEIKKTDKKNVLKINYNSLKDCDYILLNSIRLCFLIDADTMHEYFRYEKKEM